MDPKSKDANEMEIAMIPAKEETVVNEGVEGEGVEVEGIEDVEEEVNEGVEGEGVEGEGVEEVEQVMPPPPVIVAFAAPPSLQFLVNLRESEPVPRGKHIDASTNLIENQAARHRAKVRRSISKLENDIQYVLDELLTVVEDEDSDIEASGGDGGGAGPRNDDDGGDGGAAAGVAV